MAASTCPLSQQPAPLLGPQMAALQTARSRGTALGGWESEPSGLAALLLGAAPGETGPGPSSLPFPLKEPTDFLKGARSVPWRGTQADGIAWPLRFRILVGGYRN